MAKNLGIAQEQISEIEKRTDMHISHGKNIAGGASPPAQSFKGPLGVRLVVNPGC